jgi:hypothetical protein
MFPDVDTNEGDEGKERVLVGRGVNLKTLGGRVQTLSHSMSMTSCRNGSTNEPTPTAALNSKRGGIKLLLEVFEAAKLLLDSSLERAGLESASASSALGRSRGEILPEQRVIDVTYDPPTELRHGQD